MNEIYRPIEMPPDEYGYSFIYFPFADKQLEIIIHSPVYFIPIEIKYNKFEGGDKIKYTGVDGVDLNEMITATIYYSDSAFGESGRKYGYEVNCKLNELFKLLEDFSEKIYFFGISSVKKSSDAKSNLQKIHDSFQEQYEYVLKLLRTKNKEKTNDI